MVPLFGGKQDSGKKFEDTKARLKQATDEFLKADSELTGLTEWSQFADVKNAKIEMSSESFEKFAGYLDKYEKALKNLNKAHKDLQNELAL